jgi:CheY-like chemotaxis protein
MTAHFMTATLHMTNALSLVLLRLVLPTLVFAWLTATRRRVAGPVLQPAVLNQGQEPGRSGLNPKRVAEKASETSTQTSVVLPGVGRHILFVDDERSFAESGRAVLKQLGYQVTLVVDANEALAVIRDAHKKIDCVVTDLSMPGMSGFDLARISRRLLPGVPVILMTSQDGVIATELLRVCGIHGLLLKPFTQQTLAEAVQQALTGRNDRAGS